MDNITEVIVIGEEAPRRGRRPAARSGAAPAPAVEQQAAGLVADLRRDSITMPRRELAQSLHMAGATGMIAAFQYNETANRVAMLKLFAQIRDSKAYKGASVVDRNGETRVVSTWEEFCTAHGYSKRKIDEDLQNLAAFGGDFMEMQEKLGLGNRSGLLLQFLERLDIRPLHHAAGNARATGAVEVAQNIVETGFESRLRFMTVPSLEELQARADAWRRHFNATAIHRRTRKTRNAVWGSISSKQLRVATRPVMEAIAAWQDKRCKVDEHFRISVDTRACGVHEYDLRELGYHGLCVGDSVAVRLNPFLAPVIRVICRKADGTELVFEVSPVARDAAGFDITAPVIGEDYRSAPRTVQQRALDDVLATAYGTDSADEAARRYKQRDRTPFAHLDPMADVREAPLQFRRPGTPVAVEAPQAAPLPLNHAQAAMRLREMCGETWSRDPAACMALVRQRFPRQVPEDRLEELAALINGRDSARHGATVLHFDAAARTEGERACAS